MWQIPSNLHHRNTARLKYLGLAVELIMAEMLIELVSLVLS